MRDPARIDAILEAFKKVWEKSPDMRFGQLVENLMTTIGGGGRATFNIEDDDFAAKLQQEVDFLYPNQPPEAVEGDYSIDAYEVDGQIVPAPDKPSATTALQDYVKRRSSRSAFKAPDPSQNAHPTDEPQERSSQNPWPPDEDGSD